MARAVKSRISGGDDLFYNRNYIDAQTEYKEAFETIDSMIDLENTLNYKNKKMLDRFIKLKELVDARIKLADLGLNMKELRDSP